MKFTFLISLISIILGILSKKSGLRSVSIRGGRFLGRNSDKDEDDNNNSKRSTSASIQYMITNKMRKTLVEELGYLNNEVNEMDPQIAAVLLEKRLPRPMNGMPASWKRPAGTPGSFLLNFRPLTNLFARVASILKGFTSTVASGIPDVLPFALPVAAVAILVSFVPQTLPALFAGLSQQTKVFKRKAKAAKNVANEAVKDVSKSVAKKYRRRLQVVTSDLHPAEFKTFLKKPSALARVKAQAGDVNIRSFERVAERKLSDVFSIVKNSLFSRQ